MNFPPTRTTMNIHVGGPFRPPYSPTFQILTPVDGQPTSYINVAEDVRIITDDTAYLMDLADVIQKAVARLDRGAV